MTGQHTPRLPDSNPASTPYVTIVADPPWPQYYDGGGTRSGGTWSKRRYYKAGRSDLGYRTMTVEAICAIDIASVAAADAHLYLWIPDRFLIEGDGARVCRAWGFEPGRTIVWRKPNYGLGSFPRPQHETVITAKRGSLPYSIGDVGSVHDWKQVYERVGRVKAKKGSAKPPGFQDLVERASPGPYLELFARSQRLGWDTWGNEALEHVEIAT